jgi:hypothetical protein
MRKALLFIVVLTIAVIPLPRISNAEEEKPFAPNAVDTATGALRIPENYREWPTLGTWAHANAGKDLEQLGLGVHEYHTVYTQPETIAQYKKTGAFPDGAILVKELLNAETMSMKTGPAIGHATTLTGWFIMVRDTKSRFKDSPLWGDGWGWSLFEKDDPQHTVSYDYRSNCIPCHVPAKKLAPETAVKDDKWIYVLGYPVLQRK